MRTKRTNPVAGFSLIEFMIAITVSMVILAALTATFVSNSRARLEIERANQQIENGRYAVMALTDDLQLAGYLSTFNILTEPLTLPATKKPDPCVTTATGLNAVMLMHVLGYDNSRLKPDGATDVTCVQGGTNLLADYKAGTDILVVRRASTCVRGSTNCPDQSGAFYFQASMCEAQLNTIAAAHPNGPHYRLDTVGSGNLNRTARNCTTLADMRQFFVHLYFVANNDEAGDGIPTLKRAELIGEGGTARYRLYSLANGIENLQIEYGIDAYGAGGPATTPDGAPDMFTADPDEFNPAAVGTPVAACAGDCNQNWANVVSVKVSVLARNPEKTRDHDDKKIYSLGLNDDGAAQCAYDPDNNGTCDAFRDGYKRHVYQSAVRLNNVSGRRE
ncbi:MAG TPA: PilW family protein [Verrucomicrobiae bacterium]|nr:PilW family protein [Verrucomicrobiae bacterium]